jgi:hypothetical protein
MTLWLGRFSIRTLLCLVIVMMACMALGDAVQTLVDARSQAKAADRAVTLTRASRGLLKAILPLRLERGSTLALGGEAPADAKTLSTIAASRQAMIENYRRAQRSLNDLAEPAVGATLDRLNAAQDVMAALRPASTRPWGCRKPGVTRLCGTTRWGRVPGPAGGPDGDAQGG